MATVLLGTTAPRRVDVFSGGRPDRRVQVLDVNPDERERIRRLALPGQRLGATGGNPFELARYAQGIGGEPRDELGDPMAATTPPQPGPATGVGFRTVAAYPFGVTVQTNVPRPDPRAGELHRIEIGEVVMIMRERGDVVLYKKTTGKERVVFTAAELDDLAVALDGMLGHRKTPVGR